MDLNNLQIYEQFKNQLNIRLYFKRQCIKSNNIIKMFKQFEILNIISHFICIDDKNHSIYNKVPCFIINDVDKGTIENISNDEKIKHFTDFLKSEIQKITNLNQNDTKVNGDINRNLDDLIKQRDPNPGMKKTPTMTKEQQSFLKPINMNPNQNQNKPKEPNFQDPHFNQNNGLSSAGFSNLPPINFGGKTEELPPLDFNQNVQLNDLPKY